MEDILIQLALLIIGAFIGFIIPKFFSWRDEMRRERMDNYTDLLKNCYGRLLFVKSGILNRIKYYLYFVFLQYSFIISGYFQK